MRVVILCALLIGCAYAYDDDEQQVQQFAKTVKGGQGGNWQPFGPSSADLVKIFQDGHYINMRQNLTEGGPSDIDVGVCYIEVPTASLVRGGGQVPAGNGSQPHLSRIRSCCKGYIRNIHNFRRCDPVCTQECVNALCSAPETCTCFPDHVKNLGGFCIPTCPIGCQNGHCAGGECLCNEGYKLDADSKYCTPLCRENCAGIGNCTAPNTCACKPGYQSTPEGSCKPACNQCTFGDCVAPNECRCHQGFAKNAQGICAPQCGPGFQHTPQGCKPVCEHCSNGDCVGPNQCRCRQGYVNENQGQCVPKCTPDCGQSSRCVAPNVCDPPIPIPVTIRPNQPQPYQPNQHNSYQPGPYQPNNNLYPDQSVLPLPDGVPQCAQPCLNGVCVGGNQCSCNPGYVSDRVNPNMCVPNCPGGCPNGVCSAPNFCICNVGYHKDHSVKGRPTCVKRERRSVNAADAMEPVILPIFEIPEDY
ncbi:epidermal growth factor-like protein [Pectinophora gossypiella]|uniref:epidermal growth factor-like protein n=1 Tax=Pectinophora gossypiella TaxID=13191 RepID=UPI00214E0F63|nr:epidermal growth factor-like protein [Pectinophora gossypiella]